MDVFCACTYKSALKLLKKKICLYCLITPDAFASCLHLTCDAAKMYPTYAQYSGLVDYLLYMCSCIWTTTLHWMFKPMRLSGYGYLASSCCVLRELLKDWWFHCEGWRLVQALLLLLRSSGSRLTVSFRASFRFSPQLSYFGIHYKTRKWPILTKPRQQNIGKITPERAAFRIIIVS